MRDTITRWEILGVLVLRQPDICALSDGGRLQIDNPSSAVSILGTAAPLTSLFFLTYIMLQVRIIVYTKLKTRL